MEILKTGCTSAYDGDDTFDLASDCNRCGCDECNCYDKVEEDTVCYGDGGITLSNL